MPKRLPILLKGPYPANAEVARMLGILPQRARELERMMDEYYRQERLRLTHAGAPRKAPYDPGRARDI
ncbi:MAG TPA: hypothetical protein VMQ86_14970 [Bryobacteraceae bacterium]|jgi:hypothetical protein|nr:hypothetical protein [Bryobacteraceae bacterium]